jgi:triacylglycerol lipase
VNIVLVHGILGFREKFGIEYFRGVAEHFQEKGLRVLLPVLDPTQGIDIRGAQLRDQITAAFASGVIDPAEKTHIIAHSMGGLDSRWMLSPANPAAIQATIRSLTTISTPHQGSPIADLIDSPEKLAPFGSLPFGPHPNLLQPALDALGISLDGLRDLTTDYCQKVFTPKFTNNPSVAYFSVGGKGRSEFPGTCRFFALFHQYISALTGQENDGLVTVASAQWGTSDANAWPADHADEVGTNLDTLGGSSFPWLAKYDLIVANVTGL